MCAGWYLANSPRFIWPTAQARTDAMWPVVSLAPAYWRFAALAIVTPRVVYAALLPGLVIMARTKRFAPHGPGSARLAILASGFTAP